MGLLDKAKKLGAKALDSAAAAANTVIEKTGIPEKMHLATINKLAFSTDEDLKQDYINGAVIGSEIIKFATDLAVKGLDNTITDSLGVSVALESDIKNYSDSNTDKRLNEVLAEDELEEAVKQLMQNRKAAQTELLGMWKDSSNPEERAMYEKYKDEEIWVKE